MNEEEKPRYGAVTPGEFFADNELQAVKQTCAVNKISLYFSGTYPFTGVERKAGFKNPPPPGSKQ